ncbi:MAG: TonB-dependent receptor family protein [Limisphaerales bacterium]
MIHSRNGIIDPQRSAGRTPGWLWLGAAVLMGASLTGSPAESPSDPAGAAGLDATNAVAILPPVYVTGWFWDSAVVPVVPLESIGSRNVFGPEQVRETGAREINDLVQHIPAISTRPYNGGEASAPSFSMRGLPDDGLTEYLNVLIDGVPAGPLPYGWTAFSFLPVTPDRLEAVDYLRGAHAVRYSPNTVGGVLNFITTPIPQEPSAGVRGTFGDYGYLSLMGTGGGTWGATGLGATGVYREGDGYRDHGGFQQFDLNAKARHRLDEQSWIAASVSYMEDEHQSPGGLTQAQFDADPFANARPENRFDGHRFVADSVYHRDFDETAWIEGFTYLSQTERHLQAQRPHFGDPLTLSDWQDTSWFFGVGARLEKSFDLAAMEHTLYGGFRYQREWLPGYELVSSPFAGGAGALTQDSEFTTDTLSLHLDDTFKPFERLTVQLGARLEWIPDASGSDPIQGWEFEEDYFTVLPGVGVSYELTGQWAVFANYFEGFRAPQVWGYRDAAVADHGLIFESSRAVEAGTRVRGPLGFNGATTFWLNNYDDFGVYYDNSYNNLGEILAQGVDFELEWLAGRVCPTFEGFSVAGSFTLQDSELRSGPFEGNDVPYAWHHKASWRVRYARQGWTATLGGTYVGDSFSDEANTSVASADGRLGINPSRVIWDARLAKLIALTERAGLELAVGANNLFDHDWYVHSRGGFFGPGLAAGPPRQVYGSVNLSVKF